MRVDPLFRVSVNSVEVNHEAGTRSEVDALDVDCFAESVAARGGRRGLEPHGLVPAVPHVVKALHCLGAQFFYEVTLGLIENGINFIKEFFHKLWILRQVTHRVRRRYLNGLVSCKKKDDELILGLFVVASIQFA